MSEGGNLYGDLPATLHAEQFLDLLDAPNLRIERIVSTGHATPPGEWLDQSQAEWVILLRGAAGLLFAGEEQPRVLKPGDHVSIPAHCRHRVEWTATGEPTIWLAVHYAA
ncbi:MAG TPA: cupin domain-containing protein [Stellaceae bacterium]|nr:cupin domain-containing protein [Stellaceae bacterium]